MKAIDEYGTYASFVVGNSTMTVIMKIIAIRARGIPR
jgi:hypothetical protein